MEKEISQTDKKHIEACTWSDLERLMEENKNSKFHFELDLLHDEIKFDESIFVNMTNYSYKRSFADLNQNEVFDKINKLRAKRFKTESFTHK